MRAELIEKLLDAGYSKAEIDQMTAEQVEKESADEKEQDPKEGEVQESEVPKESVESKDPFIEEYKTKIEGVYEEIKKAAAEIQKFNVRHSQQPEVKTEDAGDILFKSVATIIPPPGKAKE